MSRFAPEPESEHRERRPNRVAGRQLEPRDGLRRPDAVTLMQRSIGNAATVRALRAVTVSRVPAASAPATSTGKALALPGRVSSGPAVSHYEETRLPDGRVELHAWGRVGDAIERPGLEKKYPGPKDVGLPGFDRWHLAGPNATGAEDGIAYAQKNFNISETALTENLIRRARAATEEQGGETFYDFRAVCRVQGEHQGPEIRILERVTWNVDVRPAGSDNIVPVLRDTATAPPVPSPGAVSPPNTPATSKTAVVSPAAPSPAPANPTSDPPHEDAAPAASEALPLAVTPATGGATAGQETPAPAAPSPQQLQARVGMPDMKPAFEGGPDARGSAIGNGTVVGLQGLNFVLSWLNERTQRRRLQEALTAREPEIARLRRARPDCGVLVRIHFRQIDGHPDSPIQPGPVFERIEFGVGRSDREALNDIRVTPSLRPGLTGHEHDVVAETLWVPALNPQAPPLPRPPFPIVGLATFASSAPVLQNVEWSNLGGFDDEDLASLSLPPGSQPRFYVLQVPAEMASWIPRPDDPEIKRQTVPLDVRRGIPVVRLDPVMPFFDVAAAALFPADQATLELFDTTPPTINHNDILVDDFDLIRWARPEQIKLLKP